MPKRLSRFVALFLIPCLLADPILAAVSFPNSVTLPLHAQHFQGEALMVRALAFAGIRFGQKPGLDQLTWVEIFWRVWPHPKSQPWEGQVESIQKHASGKLHFVFRSLDYVTDKSLTPLAQLLAPLNIILTAHLQESIFSVPVNADDLNQAIDQFERSPMRHQYPWKYMSLVVRFYNTWGKIGEERWLRRFAEKGVLPLAFRGPLAIHDRRFHLIGALFLPSDLVEEARWHLRRRFALKDILGKSAPMEIETLMDHIKSVNEDLLEQLTAFLTRDVEQRAPNMEAFAFRLKWRADVLREKFNKIDSAWAPIHQFPEHFGLTPEIIEEVYKRAGPRPSSGKSSLILGVQKAHAENFEILLADLNARRQTLESEDLTPLERVDVVVDAFDRTAELKKMIEKRDDEHDFLPVLYGLIIEELSNRAMFTGLPSVEHVAEVAMQIYSVPKIHDYIQAARDIFVRQHHRVVLAPWVVDFVYRKGPWGGLSGRHPVWIEPSNENLNDLDLLFDRLMYGSSGLLPDRGFIGTVVFLALYYGKIEIGPDYQEHPFWVSGRTVAALTHTLFNKMAANPIDPIRPRFSVVGMMRERDTQAEQKSLPMEARIEAALLHYVGIFVTETRLETSSKISRSSLRRYEWKTKVKKISDQRVQAGKPPITTDLREAIRISLRWNHTDMRFISQLLKVSPQTLKKYGFDQIVKPQGSNKTPVAETIGGSVIALSLAARTLPQAFEVLVLLAGLATAWILGGAALRSVSPAARLLAQAA